MAWTFSMQHHQKYAFQYKHIYLGFVQFTAFGVVTDLIYALHLAI